MSDPTPLKDEIRMLGRFLGECIQEHEGADAYELEEKVRFLAKARRRGDKESGRALKELIAQLKDDDLLMITRAFSLFFDLTNLAEDRYRVDVLRQRERSFWPEPRKESIGAAIDALPFEDQASLEELLQKFYFEPVFTAHPTETKRRTVRNGLARIRKLLESYHRGDLLPRERLALEEGLKGEIKMLWQTAQLASKKPTVIEELERGLAFLPTLWKVVPKLLRQFRGRLEEKGFAVSDEQLGRLFRFSNWIGGDRDGNPFVTASVTQETLHLLRSRALELHIEEGLRLQDELSSSSYRVDFRQNDLDKISLWEERFQLEDRWPKDEVLRRWLEVVLSRLRACVLEGSQTRGYGDPQELYRDIFFLKTLVSKKDRSARVLEKKIESWLAQIAVFGFHLLRLDIRQESLYYHEVVAEILAKMGICQDYQELSQEGRWQILTHLLKQKPQRVASAPWSEKTFETLALFRVLNHWCQEHGNQALACHVISMTHQPSDILAAWWLSRSCGDDLGMPLVMLLETMDDLERGAEILEQLYRFEPYQEYLREHHENRQQIMLGYSDGTKDGGYLQANWRLYLAQEKLLERAQSLGIELRFFHGRGGSLGRGGGPAARSVLSLPGGTLKGGLRVTEQGEVLAQRYDDPQIAYRHLEQMAWSLIVRLGRKEAPIRQEHRDLMGEMMADSGHYYRQLIEEESFVEQFRSATPLRFIETLNLGSRPSRRKSRPGLEGLRAIPWVFSWTQSRVLLPAWYGLGYALEKQEPERLQELYREWGFFRAVIDNASLALSKADMEIASLYLKEQDPLWSSLKEEYERAVKMVLVVTEEKELLEKITWLQESLRRRNPYVDPLNFIQAHLLKEKGEGALRQTLERMTVYGIAAGLRSSG